MSQLYDHVWKKYVTCIVFAHHGLQKPHSVVRYPVHMHMGAEVSHKDYANLDRQTGVGGAEAGRSS